VQYPVFNFETTNIYIFSPGKGVLVKQDTVYYYPGCLISWDEHSLTWTIQMWRGIQNELANKILHDVPVSNIVDGLWQDDKGRRKIRVCSTLIHNCTKVTK